MDLVPGALIADRYRVERKVGEGGMGEVWAGEHLAIGVRVALKVLLPAARCDPQSVARFHREAFILGRLRSDHVSRVVDFVDDPAIGLVLVMDFIEGEALAEALRKRRLSVEEAIDLGVDVATALADLHRAQIVHRDLKPDNILLEPRANGRRRAVLVDFGVSRLLPQHGDSDGEDSITGITRADTTVGTIPYMAPEQLLGSRNATFASDVYALGAILYLAITGEQVFGALDEMDYAKHKLSHEAPPLAIGRADRAAQGFQALVARALQKRPEARFASADAMLRDLLALRDLAHVMALDLDATTTESLGNDVLVEDPTVDDGGPLVRAELTPIPPVDTGPPASLAAPPPPAPTAAPPAVETPRRRTIPMKLAVVGMIAALAVGAALGFGAHRLAWAPAAHSAR